MLVMLTAPATIEALLFTAGEPLEKKRLAALINLSESDFDAALAGLTRALQGRGIALIETDTEVELRTSPEAAEAIHTLRESELARDLGKASLETLAVIAYQAGTTRSEIDWVRGVNSSGSVRTLLMRGLIEGNEDPRDKRRIRYSLTTEALAHLGLSRVEELPRYGELSSGARDAIADDAARST